MLLALYRGLMQAAGPFLPWLLARRERAGKEVAARRGERLGRPGMSRPPGRLAWLHGASVGEALSALALIRRIREHAPGAGILLTTGTVTSARLMADRLPPGCIHQFVPIDRPAHARRFLDHWRPDLALWIESELWPGLLGALGRRGVPSALVNARMSAASARRWARLPSAIGPLLATFDIVLPWSEAEGARFRALGAARIGPPGNLKFLGDPPAAAPDAMAALTGAVGGRPVWLAVSTHRGEEESCLLAHRAAAARRPDLLTIIAPRHPDRGGEVASAAAAAGLAAVRRSEGAMPSATTGIYVADTIGEMGLLLRTAGIAFVGGSLVAEGGHNPIEAAQLGAAILYGPNMTNFPDVTGPLEAAGAAIRVDDAGALAVGVARLLDDPSARRAQADAARSVIAAGRRQADRSLDALGPLLARAGFGS